MLKFSLRDCILIAVIIALCFGMGTNHYRTSKRLAAVERHNQRLASYASDLRDELKNAKKSQEEVAAINGAFANNGSVKICPTELTYVRWEILDEPIPQIGFKRAGEP